MNQFISPNWHVILIHYPLALLGVGILIEIFSFLWKRSTVRLAGRWMLLLGILSCIPTVTSGLFAFRQIVNSRLDLDQTWGQVKAESMAAAGGSRNFTDQTGPRLTSMWHDNQWAWMREHILWEAVGTGILVLALLTYVGASDLWRRRLYLPVLILLLAGFLALSSGAWHAGEAIYQYGTAVEGPHKLERSMALLTGLHTKLQLHVIMAGWVVALGVLALAVSIRALNEGPIVVTDEAWLEAGQTHAIDDNVAVDSHGNPVAPIEIDPRTEEPLPFASPFGSETTAVVNTSPLIATSRWWLLTALLAVMTVAGGLWVALGTRWNWPTLREMFLRENRNLWHSILGSSILVLALILALTTRVARKNKWVLAFFSLLMLIAIAGQIWMGILLMYDSPKGPNPQLWRWNPEVPTSAAASRGGLSSEL